MALTDNSVNAAALEPLHVRGSCEESADTTDVEFLSQVEVLRLCEKARWAGAAGSPHSANDVAFPIPSELSIWSRQYGYHPRTMYQVQPSRQLQPLYHELGTWEVSAEQASAAISLRLAAPMDLGLPQKRPQGDFLNLDAEEARVEVLELAHWDRIEAVKQHERTVWGCFDSAKFPALMNASFDVNQSIFASCCRVEISTLRIDVHANETVLVTSIDETGSAWRMMPEAVVNAVPQDVFAIEASGGFCCRAAEAAEHLQQTTPPDDWLCAICLDENSDGAVVSLCRHTFHRVCILKWLQKSSRCPLCRGKCRLGPAVMLPPMVFDLEPWPMLPTEVIAEDTTTSVQEATAHERKRRPLTMDKIEARRKQLADRFKCQVPSASFFQHKIVQDEEMIGLAAVQARIVRDRQEEALLRDRLNCEGQAFTSWPVAGRWSDLPTCPRIEAARAELTARLTKRFEQRRLQMQGRTPQGLARYLLRQYYTKLPHEHNQTVSICNCSAPDKVTQTFETALTGCGDAVLPAGLANSSAKQSAGATPLTHTLKLWSATLQS